MVTVRSFSNQAEAALAKSVLDDHNITSSLADENSYLYGGAPMAMPVRLLVAEAHAAEATRILENGGREDPDVEDLDQGALPSEDLDGKNPWELLVIASLIALPGVVLMLQTRDLVVIAPYRRISRRAISIISASDAHLLGAFVIAAAASLVVLFFYLGRRQTRQ